MIGPHRGWHHVYDVRRSRAGRKGRAILAARHYMSVYRVAVHRRGEPDTTLVLGNFYDSGARLGPVLLEILTKLEPAEWAGGDRRAWPEDSTGDAVEPPYSFSVLFHIGESGEGYPIYHGEDHVFDKIPLHTAVFATVLTVLAPPSAHDGVVIAHRIGQHSPFGQVRRALTTDFASRYPDHVLSIDTMIPDDLLADALAQDAWRLKEVKVSHRIVNDDPTLDEFGELIDMSKPVDLELRVSPSRFSGLRKEQFQSWLEHNVNANGSFIFGGVEWGDVEAQFRRGTQRRTYTVSSGQVPRFSEDVTDRFEDPDNWTLEEAHSIGVELAAEHHGGVA